MQANNTARGVSLRVDPAELNRWKLAARKDRRTLAGWIKVVLSKASDSVLGSVITDSEPIKAQDASKDA